MKGFVWIGKTDTPRFLWGYDGDNYTERMKQTIWDTIEPQHSSVYFRKEKELFGGIKKATARICGLGLYAFYINGVRVGKNVLTPLETNYRKRVLYDVYDITEMLCGGKNVFAAEVGNGRYSTPKKYWDWRAGWYGDPLLTVRISLEFDDGRKEYLSTDTDWKTSSGARIENCFYDGETYDESAEQVGWNAVGFDDSSWQNALIVSEPGGKTEENSYFSITRSRILSQPKSMREQNGAVLYDFGENVAGWVKLRFFAEEGDTVTIRYAERITDGKLDASSNEHALCTDVYKVNKTGMKEYEPCFTLRGYSAVEISSEKGSAAVEKIEGYAVHADLPQTGEFCCDNAELNRLHAVILRTQSSALMSYPIDCPQRDERLGWLGDAHVTDRVCLYNFDMREYYKKWLEDIRLEAHSGEGYIPFIAPWHTTGHAADWSGGYAILLWDYYLFYRDTELLKKHLPTLARYADYLERQGFVLPRSRYGDWMSTLPDWKRGDPECCTTLFMYQDLVLLTKIATVLGLQNEYKHYFDLTESVKNAVSAKFFSAKEKRFDDNSQFSVAFALKLGLIPEPFEKEMGEVLLSDIRARDYHLTTGILGTKIVCELLGDISPDTAMRILLQDTYPSFLDLIRNKTTLSETWAGGRSQNHCMFGSADELFYTMLCGIKRTEDAFAVSPYFAEELSHVKGKVRFPEGSIEVEWNGQERITVSIRVEGNIAVRYHDGCNERTLTDGEYRFTVPRKL